MWFSMGMFDVVVFKTPLFCPYCKEELSNGDSELGGGWQTKDFDPPLLNEFVEGQLAGKLPKGGRSFEANNTCKKCKRFISFNFAITDGKITANMW